MLFIALTHTPLHSYDNVLILNFSGNKLLHFCQSSHLCAVCVVLPIIDQVIQHSAELTKLTVVVNRPEKQNTHVQCDRSFNHWFEISLVTESR